MITDLFAGPYGLLLKIGTIVLVLGGLYLFGYKEGRESMAPKVEAAKSEAELWRKVADNRKTLTEAQNQAVASLKEKHDAEVSAMNKRLATAILEGRKIRKAAEKKADAILSKKLSENECTALTELIDEARK